MLDTLTYQVLTEQLITEFLTGVKEELLAYLASNNRNASGRSADSIQLQNVTQTGGQLVGASHIQYVFTGRGPGKMPPLSNIIDWLNSRGLPRSMAWGVAKRIAEFGTKLYQQGGYNNNAVLTALSPDKIKAFTEAIAKTIAVELTSEVVDIFK